MRKIKHITSIIPLTRFPGAPSGTFLRTYTISDGVPWCSWVLNLGSFTVACQQLVLQGEKDGERLWVRAKNEERGEPRLLLEVNNEVSADTVSQSGKTVTDFHLGGILERHLKESRAENADKHKGAYARRPLYFPSPVCTSKCRQRCFRHLERSRCKHATC